MVENKPHLDLKTLDDAFVREGAEGLRSAIAFGRASFGVPLHDAVALDGGILDDGSLNEGIVTEYESLEEKLMAHRGQVVVVVGAFTVAESIKDDIHAMSVSVGVLNPDADHIIRPRVHTLGAEIDTGDRHAEVWHYVDHLGNAGIQ